MKRFHVEAIIAILNSIAASVTKSEHAAAIFHVTAVCWGIAAVISAYRGK